MMDYNCKNCLCQNCKLNYKNGVSTWCCDCLDCEKYNKHCEECSAFDNQDYILGESESE